MMKKKYILALTFLLMLCGQESFGQGFGGEIQDIIDELWVNTLEGTNSYWLFDSETGNIYGSLASGGDIRMADGSWLCYEEQEQAILDLVNSSNLTEEQIARWFNGASDIMLDEVTIVRDSNGNFDHTQFLNDVTISYLNALDRYDLNGPLTFQGMEISIDSANSPYNWTLLGTMHTSQFIYDQYMNHEFAVDPYSGYMNYYSNVVLHEFGHYLHANMDPLLFYDVAVLQSLASSSFDWEKYTWSESTANTLSYFWNNEPAGWDFKKFPVDFDVYDEETKQKLRDHEYIQP